MFSIPEEPSAHHTALYEKLKAGGALVHFQEWSNMTARIHVDVPAHAGFFHRHELRLEGWASTSSGVEYRMALCRKDGGTVCQTHASLWWTEAASMADYMLHLANMLSNPETRDLFQLAAPAGVEASI